MGVGGWGARLASEIFHPHRNFLTNFWDFFLIGRGGGFTGEFTPHPCEGERL